MIILIIYILGIFITPIILKKLNTFKDFIDEELCVVLSCLLWPIALVIAMLFKLTIKFMNLLMLIYNKV